MVGVERFAAALVELEAELDWERLGRSYCESGGDDFFAVADREALRETGLRMADDLAAALAELPPREAGGAGASLYVGAALAELAPMLCEALVLRRSVHAYALAGPEADELNRALDAVARAEGLDLPRIRTRPLEPADAGRVDHLWMASVLTDPDAFPALHDELYERSGTELATGRGDLPRELVRARDLCRRACEPLADPALITTSDEELPFFHERARLLGRELESPSHARLSAIVGDPLRIHRLRSRPA